MKDLNYQLKQLCHQNRDGSYSTQSKRAHHLMQIANQLHALGFHGMNARSLKPKHVDALVQQWLAQDLSAGTIKNRMAVLRWWAQKVDKQNVVARSNDHYGIPDRQFVTHTSKAKTIDQTDLQEIAENHVRLSLELQKAFGLRREEATSFSRALRMRSQQITQSNRLKASWTKGGKERSIPIRNEEQRTLLERIKREVGNGSLIPADRNYVQQLRIYERQTANAGLSRMHGLRHAYVQQRYQGADRLVVIPAAGGTDFEAITELVSRRIINEVTGISRVAYDISGKLPATI